MRKQKLVAVVLAAGVVLGAAVFAGYESTRYTRTVQAAEQEWQLGDTEEAIPIYEKAIRMKPKRAEAYLALAEIYERNKRHADAVSLLKTAGEVRQNFERCGAHSRGTGTLQSHGQSIPRIRQL